MPTLLFFWPYHCLLVFLIVLVEVQLDLLTSTAPLAALWWNDTRQLYQQQQISVKRNNKQQKDSEKRLYQIPTVFLLIQSAY